jgi:AcrR family transcriptional regulator
MRPQLTDQEVEAFRGRLVRAAAKLFAAHGVAGVTMRQIAKSLGYSQTAAYRYFADKDEILAAVRAAALDRFCTKLEAALKPGKDARENARAVGQAYLRFAVEEPDSYRLIFDSSGQDLMVPEFSQTANRINATMTDYVRALVDEGYLEGDPVELGRAFWVAAHGAVMLHLSGFLPSLKARDQLHRASERLIYRGAEAGKTKRPSRPGKLAARHSRPA